MSRTHTNQDVYLDDALAATNAQVIENPDHDRLRVKARVPGRPGVWEVVVELTGLERRPDEQGDTAVIKSWSGVDAEGESHVLATISRSKPCCGKPR